MEDVAGFSKGGCSSIYNEDTLRKVFLTIKIIGLCDSSRDQWEEKAENAKQSSCCALVLKSRASEIM